MSTQLRRIAQAPAHSPVRTKFFLALASTTGGAAVVPAASAASVMTSADFAAAVPSTTGLAANGLYRDMGREIIVTDAAGVHLQKWRAVQLVSGAATEGVGADNNLYARVWDAAGTNVYVVRTG
jgi:hypothetical protein